jgi:trk system potassium uptake protein TrkA
VSLSKLPTLIKHKVLVCAAERDGNVLIPDGSFVMREGDSVSVTARPEVLRKFFTDAGSYQKPVKNVMLLGGSRIAVYLTQLLESTGVKVTIVESSNERCQQLAELLQNADIVNEDGTDTSVLARNDLRAADGFVALTNIDEENIILSIYAKKFGVEKVVSKINNEKFADLLRDVFPDTTVSPKNLVAERIEGYVRGLAHASEESTIEALYYLGNREVTATEFVVGAKAACVGKTLAELRLKPGVLICAVTRGGRSFLPDGNTALEPGDKAIIVTAGRSVFRLDDMLA